MGEGFISEIKKKKDSDTSLTSSETRELHSSNCILKGTWVPNQTREA